MQRAGSQLWQSPNPSQLAEALTAISDKTTMQNFLRDVMTEKEIIEMPLEAAKMLTDGKKYAEIVTATKLSSRTVARISDWLQNGCGGYQTIIESLNQHHSHPSPARAD